MGKRRLGLGMIGGIKYLRISTCRIHLCQLLPRANYSSGIDRVEYIYTTLVFGLIGTHSNWTDYVVEIFCRCYVHRVHVERQGACIGKKTAL